MTIINEIKALFQSNPEKTFCMHQIHALMPAMTINSVAGFLTKLRHDGFIKVKGIGPCSFSKTNHTHYKYCGSVKLSGNIEKLTKEKPILIVRKHKKFKAKKIKKKTLYIKKVIYTCPHCSKEIEINE